MSIRFIYHYWNDRDSLPRYRDIANPILGSIACLRSYHPDVPISVIDISEKSGDWGAFPKKLAFEVVAMRPSIPKPYSNDLGINLSTYKYCSSVFDVYNEAMRVPEENIVFLDSDIFLLDKLLPLDFSNNKLNIMDGFVGYYYFNKNNPLIGKFFNLWSNVIVKALTDFKFREKIAKDYHVPGVFNQESSFIYLKKVIGDTHTHPLTTAEHCFDPNYNDPVKFFHFTGYYYGMKRGFLVLGIKEIGSKILEVLGEVDFSRCYGISAKSNWIGRVPFKEGRTGLVQYKRGLW